MKTSQAELKARVDSEPEAPNWHPPVRKRWYMDNIVDVRIRADGRREFLVRWTPTRESEKPPMSLVCSGGFQQYEVGGKTYWYVDWKDTWEPPENIPQEEVCKYYETRWA
jgi:hypothetical protein